MKAWKCNEDWRCLVDFFPAVAVSRAVLPSGRDTDFSCQRKGTKSRLLHSNVGSNIRKKQHPQCGRSSTQLMKDDILVWHMVPIGTAPKPARRRAVWSVKTGGFGMVRNGRNGFFWVNHHSMVDTICTIYHMYHIR